MHAVLERVVSQISSELRDLNAETTQLHPKDLAYKWNAQQVVEHLVLGYRLTSSALETRLNKGRLSRNRQRTYLQWSLQLMILSFGKLSRAACRHWMRRCPLRAVLPLWTGDSWAS